MITPSFCKNVAQMPDWGCGAHNRGRLQSRCKCHKKNKKKGFYSSQPIYHYPDKPLNYYRKPKYNKEKYHRSTPKKFIKRKTKMASKEK